MADAGGLLQVLDQRGDDTLDRRDLEARWSLGALLDRLQQLSPWPVRFFDPAPAIARRVVDLLGPASPSAAPGTARAIFTSGRPPQAVLRRFDIRSGERASTSSG